MAKQPWLQLTEREGELKAEGGNLKRVWQLNVDLASAATKSQIFVICLVHQS